MADDNQLEKSHQEIEAEFQATQLWLNRRLRKNTADTGSSDFDLEKDLNERLRAITLRPDYQPQLTVSDQGVEIKLYEKGGVSFYSNAQLEKLGQGKGVDQGKATLGTYLREHPARFFGTGDKPQTEEILPK